MRKGAAIAGILLLLLSLLLIFAIGAQEVNDVSLERLGASASEPERVFPAGDKGYLVVAPESSLKLGAVRRFVEHKNSLGLDIHTVSVEEIGKMYAADELADKIRQYLKDNSAKLELRYVLLVGDPDPADLKVDLPVDTELPPYIVSVPSRSLGGTYASEQYNGEITSEGKARLFILTGPNLQVLRSGKLRYWYVNCTKPGRIRFVVVRREGDEFKQVFASGMETITKPGVAVRSTQPVQLEEGDLVGFGLPAEGAAAVAAVKMPNTECAQIFELEGSGRQESFDAKSGNHVEELPLVQCSVYFEPDDRIGAVPSKMCWPMGTFNGVYGALLRDSCLAQCPTDAYYANLTADWDLNGNGFFGETFLKFFRYDGGAEAGKLDSGDFSLPWDAFLPELLVGRIPFDDPETVSAILDKTIAYEKSADKNWRKHCLLGADPLAPDTDNYALCELIKSDICDPAGFEVTRYYTEHVFEESPFIQSPATFEYAPEFLMPFEELYTAGRNTMVGYERFSRLWAEKRPGFVLWSSHANTDICRNIITLRDESDTGYPQVVTRRYVDALDNTHPAIVFAAACSVTQPEVYYLGIRKKRTELEHNWEKRPNLGRELLKNGAVAVVAPTRSTWFRHGWDSLDDGGCLSLAYYFAEALVAGETVGHSLAAATRDYCTRWGSELADGENIIGFVVYGDPSISLGVGRGKSRPLLRRQASPELTIEGPADPREGAKIKVVSESGARVEAGMLREIDSVRANADGAGEWFEGRDFAVSNARSAHGDHSYYSGTARCRPATFKLDMPLVAGQELKASFDCWYHTEPGIDYVVFESSVDGVSWEPLDVYSGVSTQRPLFDSEQPTWRRKMVEFSIGESPTYLRFRYVTYDQYRKEPREGFYLDNFILAAKGGGRVRYLTGWQKVNPTEAEDVFDCGPPRPGTYYLRAACGGSEAEDNEACAFYILTVSEPRAATFGERLASPLVITGLLCALFGLVLLIDSTCIRRKPAK